MKNRIGSNCVLKLQDTVCNERKFREITLRSQRKFILIKIFREFNLVKDAQYCSVEIAENSRCTLRTYVHVRKNFVKLKY